MKSTGIMLHIQVIFICLQVDCIVALASFGGRPDQVFANINTLYEAIEVTDVPVYLVADDSLACLLGPVSNTKLA